MYVNMSGVLTKTSPFTLLWFYYYKTNLCMLYSRIYESVWQCMCCQAEGSVKGVSEYLNVITLNKCMRAFSYKCDWVYLY